MSIKKQLHDLCLSYAKERLAVAEEAIRTAQASANEETKSSSGDKYETGRAMAQLEIEKNAGQRTESLKLLQILAQIDPAIQTTDVRLGSLVSTDRGHFYVAISANQLKVDGQAYVAISPASPLCLQMIGLAAKATFTFRGNNFTINSVQ